MRCARRLSSFLACSALLGLIFFAVPGTFAAPMTMPQSLPNQPGKSTQALQTLLNDLASQHAQVINIQRELVTRPAISPMDGGDGEEAKARWIENWLRENGLPQAERIDVPDKRVSTGVRPNLIVRYPGMSARTLWIVCKMDVTTSGPEVLWTGSPWALRVEGDILYGRGVSDNHQGIAAGLTLLHSLTEYNVIPPLSLGLILTSGDKTDLPPIYGIEAVLKARPDLIRLDDLVVVNSFGTAQGDEVDVTEKALLWLKVTVFGKSAHSSSPGKGVNALDTGAELIVALRSLSALFPAQNDLFSPPFSSFTPTRIDGKKSATNQIPAEFSFSLDCRLLPPYTVDEVEAAVRMLSQTVAQKNGADIRLERVHERDTSLATPEDALVVQSLIGAIHAQTGKKARPVGRAGVSQAYALRSRGLPVAVWSNVENRGFETNESVPVSAQLEAAQIFARMLFDYDAVEKGRDQTKSILTSTAKTGAAE